METSNEAINGLSKLAQAAARLAARRGDVLEQQMNESSEVRVIILNLPLIRAGRRQCHQPH
jgi:hypothetical protein